MITGLFLNLVVVLIGFVFSWLPVVTVLPTIFGQSMDTAVATVFSLVQGILVAVPFMGIVWACLLWYYGIKIFLLTWTFVRWFINLVRGSGS